MPQDPKLPDENARCDDFRDPWDYVPEEEKYLLQARIPTNIYMYLKGMRLVRGTIQITTAMLLAKLVNELTRLNILDYTRRGDFERVVANLELRMPGPDDPSNPRAVVVVSADGKSLTPTTMSPPAEPSGPTPAEPGREATDRDVGRGTEDVRRRMASTAVDPADAPSRPSRRGGGERRPGTAAKASKKRTGGKAG